MQTRRLLVTIMALILLGVGLVAAEADAATPAVGMCHESGTVILTPGLTASPQKVTLTFTGTVSPCLTSGPSILSGTESGSGNFTGSCASGTGSTVYTVVWDNGKKTSATFTFNTLGPTAVGMNKYIHGEFAGGEAPGYVVFTPTDPSACTSPGGASEVTFDGWFGVGGS